MSTYISTLKAGQDQLLPRTKTAAVTDANNISLDTILAGKVDEVSGKGLSTNDFTNSYKESVDSVVSYIPSQTSAQNQLADKAFVQSVAANFRGNWTTWTNVPSDSSLYPEDYAGSKVPTVNDYIAVQNTNDFFDTTQKCTITKNPSTYAFVLTYSNGETSTVTLNGATSGVLGKNSEFIITAIGNSQHTISCVNKTLYNNTVYNVGATIVTAMYYNALSADIYLSAYKGAWRFRYGGVWSTNGKNGWYPEYQINEELLTSAQIVALNSGITSSLVGQISTAEQKANKTTTLSAQSTDTQYPSAKAVYDKLVAKANKVASAVAGDFAGLDANGNLVDSGKKASDFLQAVNATPAGDIVAIADTLTGISNTSVNQIAVVNSVNANGIPTGWKTVTDRLPVVTSADNGKILKVVDGVWTAVSLPSANGVSF